MDTHKNQNSLGEALRLFRVFHDLTLSEISEKLDVTPGYISSIENGRKMPNLEMIEKYAKVFETVPSAILFFSEDLQADKSRVGVKSKIRSRIIRFMKAIESAGTS